MFFNTFGVRSEISSNSYVRVTYDMDADGTDGHFIFMFYI